MDELKYSILGIEMTEEEVDAFLQEQGNGKGVIDRNARRHSDAMPDTEIILKTTVAEGVAKGTFDCQNCGNENDACGKNRKRTYRF